MKKSLIFWFAAVTCAALFLVGCESPTDGDAGAAGSPGSVTFSGDVTDAELARAFAKSNEVILQSTVTSVYGVIPAGKTLAVFGSGTAVTAGESLEVAGALEIETGAALNASYVSGTAGYLATDGGGITGTGTVSLPYLAAGVTDGPTGIVTYGNSPGGITKTAGSYITGSAAAPASSALDVDDIEALFTLPGGPAELTVSDIATLTAAAVPSGKTLTLEGDGNTVTTALDLASGGTLIVNGTLTDSTGVAITASGTTSNITINGTLALVVGSTVVGKVTNDGTITSAATAATTQKALLTLEGDGKVVLSGEGAAAVNDTTLALTQNVEITNSGTLKAPVVATPFSGGKTITISGTGVLDFGAAVAGLSLSGVTIVNNGTDAGAITTATVSDKALGVIMGAGGKITATGAITELTQALTVPADVDLTTDATATFATGEYAVTVNGKFTANAAATFAGKAIAIGDGGVLNVGAGTSFAPTSITSVEGGKLVVAPVIATLQSILGKAGANLNIEASPEAITIASSDMTVKPGTVLTLKAGSITTASGGSADLIVKGKIIAGGLTLDGHDDANGIVTTFGAGITVSVGDGMSIGANDEITIPTNASINLGGENGITLGAGTYSAGTAAVTIKMATGVPTLTGTDNFVFNVGADTDEGGLLTVGSGSAIVKAGTAKVFTANTEEHPEATKLAVNIAAGATITATSGNDGGITLTDGTIAGRNTSIPGVSGEVGLQLLGSDAESAGWKAGNPSGVGT